MIVIKIGGSEGVQIEKICEDVHALVESGSQVLLVHGGSAETNDISTRLGNPPRFVTSPSGFTSRYTDRATLEIFAMVTNGRINTLLVEGLQKIGVNALGLSGLDGKLMTASRKDAIRVVENGKVRMLRDDFTGKIEQVNYTLLKTLVDAGYTPVVAPLALSQNGEALNVDADRAAAMLAGAVKASTLIILTNVCGLMRDFPDENTLIPAIRFSGLEQALTHAEGRMKKKVLGASEAIGMGVGKVIFADGRVEHPVQQAMKGKGTVITP